MGDLLAFLEDQALPVTIVAVAIAFIGWALATGVSAKAIRRMGWIIFALPAAVILFQVGRLVRWGIQKTISLLGQ
jgi:hypothetical protein